jgi:uncharacterized repeat protein (TIGR01451 family)
LIDPVHPGDPITYTLTIRNNGLINATNVEIIDGPEYDFSLISANVGCKREDDQIICSYTELAVGEEMVITLVLTPLGETGAYINQVSIQSDVADPYQQNNVDTESTVLDSILSFTINIPFVLNIID